jgi:hypothetical protein
MTMLPEARAVAAFLQARYDEEEQRVRPHARRNAGGPIGSPGVPPRTDTDLRTKRRIVAAAIAALEEPEDEATDRELALHILDLLTLPYLEESQRRHPSAHPERAAAHEAASDDHSGPVADVVPLQRAAPRRVGPRR